MVRMGSVCTDGLVLGCVVLLCSLPAIAETTQGQSVPDGVLTGDWSSIRVAYDANRYAAHVVDGGYQARNPGQQWRTQFDGRGFLTTPDSGGWSWGLELESYGRGDAQRAVSDPNCMHAQGGRVEYEWDHTLTEWYINDQRGLEHGYTIKESPEGNSTPLNFVLAARGELQPNISSDGRNVTFISTTGAAVVNYSHLTVFDAAGKTLPARFEAQADPRADSRFARRASPSFRIVIDDSGARYPITVDPIAQQAYLKASNTGAGDRFGWSVAISGDTVVVGAYGEDSSATGVNGSQFENSASESGAAYVFVRDGNGNWSQQAYLKASNTGASDLFGYSVAVSGDTVVVGAVWEDSNTTGVNGDQANDSAFNSGAAYVFVRDGVGNWSQQAYLKASNTGADDYFGHSVAVSGNTLVVGTYAEDSSAVGVNGNQADNGAVSSGAAYIFVRSGGVWSQQAYLKASNTATSDFFGSSVAVSGDMVVVGAWGEDSNATGVNGNQADNSAFNAGAAYIFVRSGEVWSQQAYCKSPYYTLPADSFGYSVAVSGETVVVGAYSESNLTSGSGAIYVLVRDDMANWSHQAYLKASNPGAGDNFGYSVAVSGDVVVVGAWQEDSNATGVNGNQSNNSAAESGAAYLFVRDSMGVWGQQAYLKASNTEADERFGQSVAVSGDTVVVGAFEEDSNAVGVNGNQVNNSAVNSGATHVFVVFQTCCPGDMSGDDVIDGNDIQLFVNRLLSGGTCP